LLLVLHVEDSLEDALLVAAELDKTFDATVCRRVETADAFREALRTERWDVVVADHRLPGFSALGALRLLQETGLDIPFIIVSGTLGEELAVEAMRAGAHDFVTKDKLARLGPAIERELRDATVRRERARAEALLRQAQEQLSVILASTQDRVFTFDRSLRVTAIYGAWLRSEGRSPADYLWRTPVELYGEHGRPLEAHCARALEGSDSVLEWTRPLEDGTLRHLQTSLSPLRGEGGAVVGGVGISRDISRLKQMEAQLVAADRMVAVGTLAASVAHEINNPLSAILANLGLALDELPAIADVEARTRLGEMLGDTRFAAQRVREIAQDLRILAREDARPGSVSVTGALEAAARLAWNELRHRARLVRELSPVPPVLGSDSRLGQVFLNLLVNAAQAIPEGNADGHRITIRTGLAPGNRVRVEVSDTGCGMTGAVLERLFTPFFTTKPSGQGTGLGLSISRRIVEDLGGTIEVESEPGRGSLFRVLLPAAPEAPPRAVEPRRLGVSAPRRARVLVVEDEEPVARVVCRALRSQHDVEAVQPRDALERVARGERFDLILCDLMMPDMTGMELHARLASAAPEQARHMLFLTGGAFTPAARAFLASGVRHVLKPFDTEDLRRAVNEALA